MDGRIVHCGIISLCQSAATSEIVKRFWSRTLVRSAIVSTGPLPFLHLLQENDQGSYGSGETLKSQGSGNLSSQGKVRGKYFGEKSGKMKNWSHEMSDFQAKMRQIRFPLGSAPDPAGVAYSPPPDPTSSI